MLANLWLKPYAPLHRIHPLLTQAPQHDVALNVTCALLLFTLFRNSLVSCPYKTLQSVNALCNCKLPPIQRGWRGATRRWQGKVDRTMLRYPHMEPAHAAHFLSYQCGHINTTLNR
eukprot:4089760-Amphidinium_carterae.2